MAGTLAQALERGLGPDGDLSAELAKLGDVGIETPDDARLVCAALRRWLAETTTLCHEAQLHPLASLFQEARSQEAFDALALHGLPVLLQIYDRWQPAVDCEDSAEDLLFLLKIGLIYQAKPVAARLAAAAQAQFYPDCYVWGVIFEELDEAHPLRFMICELFQDVRPVGFCAVCYLDFVNRLALAGELKQHPFDTKAGHKQLAAWLRSEEPEEFSYAQSAAAALAYLSPAARDKLLPLALDHFDELVQVEAAFVLAKQAEQTGFDRLVEFARDPRFSRQACVHLRELFRDDLIPAEAEEPDFEALAEMCAWLNDPESYGIPPDEIEQLDTRRIYWPPTEDERQVWLFRFKYDGDPDAEEPEETGVGMVGSITGALTGETTADMPPDDVYALHCAWELQAQRHPDAPVLRTVEAGRRLLKAARDSSPDSSPTKLDSTARVQ